MRLRRRSLMLALAGSLLLSGQVARAADPTLRVGVMAGDGEVLIEQVAAQAKTLGLTLKIVPFSDYIMPNEALNSGDLDANAFQHQPYLDVQIKARGYKLVSVGYTILAPISLYSRKYKTVADLPDGARIGIPNDPSNGGRGLNLLAAQGLLTLRSGAGISPSLADIVSSKKHVHIVELDAGMLGRSLADLDAAIVNTDWAIKSNLGPELRLATEAVDGNPYRNIIAVRAGSENDPRVQTLVKAFHSQAVRDFIVKYYQGRELPAF